MTIRTIQHSAPTAEPIHLTEAKIHLRLAVDAEDAVDNGGHHDAILLPIIAGARMQAEAVQWRSLVLQVFDLYLDEWPMSGEIEIPFPPLRAVDSISYTDSEGVTATIPVEDYSVDLASFRGRVILGDGKSWPSVELAAANPIKIRFKAGYAVPFTANAATDTLNAPNHPFAEGDMVRLSVSGGALPGGLVERKDYSIRDVVGDDFKLALTASGEAIDIASSGSGSMFVGEIPKSTIIAMLLSITDRFFGRNDSEQVIAQWLAYDSARRL